MTENGRAELPSFVPASQLAAETREGFRRGPDVTGVYLFRSARGEVVYVGKARSLRRRVLDHLRARIEKDGTILAQSTSVEFVPTATEREALLLEANLVKQYQPPYNVLLKDDRSYPYLAVTVGEEVPRILLVRRPRQSAGPAALRPVHERPRGPGRREALGRPLPAAPLRAAAEAGVPLLPPQGLQRSLHRGDQPGGVPGAGRPSDAGAPRPGHPRAPSGRDGDADAPPSARSSSARRC